MANGKKSNLRKHWGKRASSDREGLLQVKTLEDKLERLEAGSQMIFSGALPAQPSESGGQVRAGHYLLYTSKARACTCMCLFIAALPSVVYKEGNVEVSHSAGCKTSAGSLGR
jgi:hypothetical protein